MSLKFKISIFWEILFWELPLQTWDPMLPYTDFRWIPNSNRDFLWKFVLRGTFVDLKSNASQYRFPVNPKSWITISFEDWFWEVPLRTWDPTLPYTDFRWIPNLKSRFPLKPYFERYPCRPGIQCFHIQISGESQISNNSLFLFFAKLFWEVPLQTWDPMLPYSDFRWIPNFK